MSDAEYQAIELQIVELFDQLSTIEAKERVLQALAAIVDDGNENQPDRFISQILENRNEF